ncbi:MAG: hypothetical protein AAGA48_00940 [Myxococcota bacterium]
MLDAIWALTLAAPTDSVDLTLAPTADVGFPVNRIGANGRLDWTPEIDIVRFRVGLHASAYGMARDLGIPGPRLGGALSAPLAVQVGPVGLGYEPIGYFDTRNTSQPSSGFAVFVKTNALARRGSNDVGPRSRDAVLDRLYATP